MDKNATAKNFKQDVLANYNKILLNIKMFFWEIFVLTEILLYKEGINLDFKKIQNFSP